jgi:rubrerythrin
VDWLNFVKIMIIEEKAAIEKYQVAVDQAESEAVRRVFERLRDEEAFHVEFLEGEYARLAEEMKD